MTCIDEPVECTRCKQKMVLGRMGGGHEFYLKGTSEMLGRSFDQQTPHDVLVYRCPSCGRLEFFAMSR